MSESVPLSELVSLQRGKSYKSALLDQDGPILCGLGTIERNGGFKRGDLRTYGGDSPIQLSVRPGDLYLSLKDVTHKAELLGAVARFPTDLTMGRLTQDTIRLDVTSDTVIADYLYLALLDPSYRAYCRTRGTGTTNLDLSRADFLSYEIRLPAISDQQAITEVLGALDDKIAANDYVSTTSMELAGLIYDDRAQELDSIRMSQVLNPILGGTPSKAQPEFWGGDLSWASARDVAGASHGSLLRTEDHITALAIERTKAKPLPAGSVVLTARGTVGAVARLATTSSFNQSCYGFKPDRLPASLLYFGVLRAAQHAKEIAHGSVFDTISMTSFDHLFLPAWRPDDLGSLTTKLDPLLNGVDRRVAENATLAATRDALLPHLMSGKLRVREAEKKVEALV